MTTTKSLYSLLIACFAFAIISCSSDDDATSNPGDPDNMDDPADEDLFVLGVGVTTSTETTNFVVTTNDLMTGTISLEGNGELQDGYRDFAEGGDKFYSIGGLGVTDVNIFSENEADELIQETGLTFPFQLDDFVDVNDEGDTMLGISQPQNEGISSNITFYTLDIETNMRTNQVELPINSLYNTDRDWVFHTGMKVSGDKLYQTFYPINSSTFATQNTDTTYVAIYDYPALTLDQVIKDDRFGPAGAFNTRSGIFTSENGDLYTVSNSNFGFSQATKPAGIARIAAGATEFDSSYSFNTETAANGGKIIHALYIGDNKLFAAISSKVLTADNVYVDSNLRLAIVDLVAQTITPVQGAPEYTGNGGRSFAAFQDDDKVYSAISDANGVVNIYQTDIPSATAIKGAQVDASFVGGIAELD